MYKIRLFDLTNEEILRKINPFINSSGMFPNRLRCNQNTYQVIKRYKSIFIY